MANFDQAIKKTMNHEGGWVDDKEDRGGETYCGISRRFHPSWAGWNLIDAKRDRPDFPTSLTDEPAISLSVSQFYKDQFWNRFQGDNIADQAVAEELFDTGVNMGVGRAVNYLQQALNLLNRNELAWSDIVEDGQMGPRTMHALEACRIHEDNSHVLLKIMNNLQGSHYIKQMRKFPTQEKYARGWFARAEEVK